MAQRKFGDVVVLLPGITGSVLQHDGKDVWAVSKGAALQALLSLGRSVKDLEIKGPDDPTKPDLGDGITAPRLVQDVHLIPGFWQIDGYTKIKTYLSSQLTLTEGKNWFDFPYDWRRDNRVAATRLAEQAPKWLDAWRADSGNADAKLVLLAHSMGGLVARHFLEELGGWQITRELITYGTPYRGSLNAVDFLCNGMKKGFGPFSIDLSALLRSLTSVYQLLPIYPCVETPSGLARVAETTLPHVDGSRAGAALQFHRDIEAAVTRNRDDAAYRDQGYRINPVVGIFQPTNQSVRTSGDGIQMLPTYSGDDQGGDGTVPRVSATPIELSDDPREVYVTGQHGQLQNADAVLAHVVGALTRVDLTPYKATAFDGFSMDAPQLVSSGEEIRVKLRTLGPATHAHVTLTDVDTGAETRHRTVRRTKKGMFLAVLPPVAEGVYRITVTDPGGQLQPNGDLVTVLDPDTPARAAEQAQAAAKQKTRTR
jgi:pimeloyl-ACP methyl ester carboxylesterase